MEVKLRTFTPLWTGDVDQRCEGIKETGIVGSLRWWYEALLRAYGRRACDPSDSTCDGRDHCDACELFGCTGWSRKFRIEVDSNLKPTRRLGIWTRRKRRVRGRFLSRFVSGLVGKLDIRIIPLRGELKDDESYNLYKTFKLIHEYAALGSKTSQGNGVVRIENLKGFKHTSATSNVIISPKTTIFPNLADFFFSKFRLRFKNHIRHVISSQLFWGMGRNVSVWADFWSNCGFLPIAFHARDTIRPEIRNRRRRHEVFGLRERGSKVFVSHGYRIDDSTVEIRMFGYSLENREIDVLRRAFHKNLPRYVSRNPTKPLKIEVEETEFKTGMELL